MSWILFVIIIQSTPQNSSSVSSTYFDRQVSCEAARVQLESTYSKAGARAGIRTFCTQK